MASPTLVVIDDEPLVLRTLQQILSQQGYQVQGFEESLPAITYCLTHTVELVITDIDMPGIPGPELIKAIHAEKPTLYIVAISGKEDQLTDGIKAGARAVLAKPFGAQELLDVVGQALDSIQ